MHASGPGTFLYFPSGHTTHGTVASGPVYPTLHEQPVVEFALKGALFKAQQSCIVVVPESALKPAGHCVHASVPLSFENESGAQDQHAVAATASWYSPGAHNEQLSGPGTFLYFPSAQFKQGPVRSGPV